MDSLSPYVVSAAKLPILNPNEFDLWKMRLKQYFLMTDYSLWEVIPMEILLFLQELLKVLFSQLVAHLLQKLVSQLDIHRVALSQEDLNLKFLHSLPFEWKTHTLIWRNKADLEEQSLDDLFNSLKIYETEVKHSSSTGTSTQNLAFVSSSNTDSTTDSVSAAASVFTVCAKMPVSSLPNVDSLNGHVNQRARRFLQKTGINLGDNGRTSIGFDMSKSYQAEEEPANYALMDFSSSSSFSDNEVPSCSKACLESVEARLLVYKQNESIFEENIKLLNIEVQLRDTALVTLRQKLEKAEKERDDLKLKLEKFQTSSKNLTDLLACQRNEKHGLGYFSLESNCKSCPHSSLYDRVQPRGGYHVVPPPYTGTFMPPKPDLVFHTALTAVKTDHLAFNISPSFVQSTKQVKPLRHYVQPIETSISATTPKPTSPKSNSSGKRRSRKTCFVCKILTQSKLVSITAVRPMSATVPKIMEYNFDAKKPESEVNVSPSNSAQSRKQDDKTKKEAKGKSPIESFIGYRELSVEFEDCSDNSSNEVNTAGKSSFIDASQLPDDLDMPELENITHSDDDNDVGAEADFNNLETSITVSPIPTTRIHKDHPEEPKRKVYVLVGLPHGKRAIGFEDLDHPNKVYKVVKALYGLHQAPRAWYETLANYLLENGFQRGKIDQTLFINKQKGDILLVKQKIDGIFISQDKYVAEILRKFRLTEGKSASTPIDTEKPLLKDPNGEDVDVHTYRLMIGSLMYLTASRPDIMFAYKKQTVVATSSIEAGYVATASCCAQVLWIQNRLLDYGMQALVDKKKVVVMEAAIREVLRLDNEEGVDCLSNEKIFAELSMNAKRTLWNEFSSAMASAVICLSTGRKFNFSKYIFDSLMRNVDNTPKFNMYPRCIQILIRKQVGDLSTHTTKYTSLALTQKVFANMRRVRKGFSGVETPLFEGMLVGQEIEEGGDAEEHVQDVTDGDAAQRDYIAAYGEVPTISQEPSIPSPTPPTPPPQPPQDLPLISQGRIIDEMDKDDDVALMDNKEEDKKEEEAKEDEPAEVQEVVDVVTTTKLIIETKEQMEEEKSRAIQSINETIAQKAAKRRKLNKEVEDLKRHLEIMLDEDDDVYTEATPLARNVSVVDYEIINLNNKPYYKII
nr:hypothetical protein [Tanacetum cinerariifolium]